MNDGHGVWTLLAIGMDVAHYVVAQLLLLRLCHFVVNIFLKLAKLVQLSAAEGENFVREKSIVMGVSLSLLVGDVQPKLLLALRQIHPQLPPRGELVVWRPYVAHLLRAIPLRQRVLVHRFICAHLGLREGGGVWVAVGGMALIMHG